MSFDPIASGLAEEEKKNEFDPIALGLAEEEKPFDPIALGLAEEEKGFFGKVGDVLKQFSTPAPVAGVAPIPVEAVQPYANLAAQGALDQGAGSAAEGVTRVVGGAAAGAVQAARDVGADLGIGKRGEIEGQIAKLEAEENAIWSKKEGFWGDPKNPFTKDENARLDTIRDELKSLRTKREELFWSPTTKAIQEKTAAATGAIGEFRQAVRDVYAVDPEVANSTAGQVASGVGQLVGNIPAMLTGVGLPTIMGQMFDQSYQEAKQAGASESDAAAAGIANLPAAGLDYLSDKLLVGKILKPLVGKATVGTVLKDIAATTASEGATEGAQQFWQNVIAKSLVGYDPERPIDKDVLQSAIVGAIVAASSTSASNAAGGMKPGAPEQGREGYGVDALNAKIKALDAQPSPGSFGEEWRKTFDPRGSLTEAAPGASAAETSVQASEATASQSVSPMQRQIEAASGFWRSTVDRTAREDQLQAAFSGSDWAPSGLVARDSLSDGVGFVDYADWWANQIEGKAQTEGSADLQQRIQEQDRAALAARAADLEAALKGNQVSKAEFARRESDPVRPAAMMWNNIAMSEEAFQLPTTDAKDPAAIARDLSLPKKALNAQVSGRSIRFSTDRGEITVMISRPPEGETRGVAMVKAELANSAGTEDGGGARLYQAAFTWAHNNGYQLVPGPHLSPINELRRTSQMLSSALRFRTTEHMLPYAEQGVKWTPGAHTDNVEALASAEADRVFKSFPEAAKYAYDPARGQFIDNRTSDPVPDARLREVVLRSDPGHELGVGLATLKRAILTRSALSNKGAKSGIFGSLLLGDPLPSRVAGVLYARREAAVKQEFRAELAAKQAQWKANAQKIAPGLMAKFRLEFGDPTRVVELGRARTSDLTGYEEAAYLAHERIFFLFDQALQNRSDLGTRINLLHEMGHAHLDTLPAARQAELLDLWRSEIANRKGPLFDEKGNIRRGVAKGVTSDFKEWYAERVAWTNSEWAKARIDSAGSTPIRDGIIGRMAQQFRVMLAKFKEFVGQLRGEKIDLDFRSFLDQRPLHSEPPSAQLAPAFARREKLADFMVDPKGWTGAWLRRNLTSAGGLPGDVFKLKMEKDGRLAAVNQHIKFALTDLDRAINVVYGGYKAMSSAQLAAIDNVLGGKGTLASLDPRLQAPISEMRSQIDVLSRRLVREGVVSGDMALKVDGNVGFYLNRSYRKFDDASWSRNVPAAVRNRAESFIRAELQARNPGAPVADAEVKGYVDYLLSKEVEGAAAFYQGGKEGSKDLSILTARKEIPVEIRDLLGEYKDPRVNFLRSVAKTAQVLESHMFLKEVRAVGLGKFLFDRPLANAQGAFIVPIAGKNSETMAPLNGLYTTREIAEAFQKQFAGGDDLWRWWVRMNSVAKISKTVLSPVTQVRNFAGNLGFLVANGHWRASKGGDVWTAMNAVFARNNTPAARDYVLRLTRLGVLDEGVSSQELGEAMRDAGAKMQGFEPWTDSMAVRIAKSPLSVAARLYRLNDDIFKVYAFENERAAWAKAEPTWTAEQLDKVSAERVRNTLPTYSLIPQFVQYARRLGMTGSFMSFPSEIIRTTYHTIGYAVKDLQSSNPQVKAMGAKRMAGIALMATLPSAAAMFSRWATNVDDKDDDDLRRFLPSWVKNSMFYHQGSNGEGVWRLVDVSYLDPWSYLKKPFVAALAGKNLEESAIQAGIEATAPFAGEGVVMKTVLDLARNVDENGRQIVNPQAPFMDRAQTILGKVWQVYEPGLVTQAKRIANAADGTRKETGRTYNLEDETLAVLTGARRQSIDVAQSLAFKAKKFTAETSQAEMIYLGVRDRRGSVSPQELEQARVKMEASRRRIFEEFAADVAAAQRLGVKADVAIMAFLSASLTRQEMIQVLNETYFPFLDRGPSKARQWGEILSTRDN